MKGLQTRTMMPFNLQTCRNIFTPRGRTDMEEDDGDDEDEDEEEEEEEE